MATTDGAFIRYESVHRSDWNMCRGRSLLCVPTEIAKQIKESKFPWREKSILEWMTDEGIDRDSAAGRLGCTTQTIEKWADIHGLHIPRERTSIQSGSGWPSGDAYRRGIYVLQCSNDKYYVGASRALQRRLDYHFRGSGSLWTKKHHPVRIIDIEVMPGESWEGILDREDERTIELMDVHGWENVRGGKWADPELLVPPEKFREKRENVTKDEKMENLSRIANSLA